jgi:hypothetical protein
MTERELHGKDKARKRLMFVTQDDFYFLTYNLFVLLREYDCISPETAFKDIRKLGYLIDFVSDSNTCTALVRALESNLFREDDKQQFSRAYVKGRERMPFINRLVFAFEKKGLVSTVTEDEKRTISVFINQQQLPANFERSPLFSAEIENAKLLRKALPRLRSVSLSTLLENVFRAHGVTTWLD